MNGIDMHYRVLGSGEPLLLLHGFGGCGDNWRRFTRVFVGVDHSLAVLANGQYTGYAPDYLDLITDFSPLNRSCRILETPFSFSALS